MGVGILAPVPAMHMNAAVAAYGTSGRVAFGSNAWEMLRGAVDAYGAGIPVLIYPTPHHGDPDRLAEPGYVNFRAAFDRITVPKRGVHPDPRVRPITTVDGTEADTKWAIFWEVTGLVKLLKDDRIAITNLAAIGQSKPLPNGFVPYGPMLVKASFL
jgi:hypothetical protein